MKKSQNISLKLVSALSILLIISVSIVIANNIFVDHSKSEVETLLLWTGLTAIPEWAENFEIETEGGAMTRQFNASFNGSSENIALWVASDPVFDGVEKETIGDQMYKYVIPAKNGAQYAEVVTDLRNNQVTIRTYWS